MAFLPPDPLSSSSISELGDQLRRGAASCESITAAYLRRIDLLDARLGSFTYIANDQALTAARAVDRLLATGIDLGPLMGMPVAVKDLFTVSGMPTKAGSDLPISDLVQPEGSFVTALKRAGCVILGKTRMSEFALGGINFKHRVPWNPWDATTQRTPGGSSSGSAVAMAGGLCAFAVGSDTGGSVRLPAALCGVFGYKSTAGLWPVDGVFPLAPTLDSIGTFSATARDAAIVASTLTGRPAPVAASLSGMRLGRPLTLFFDDLAPEVDACVRQALSELERAGVEIVPIDVPEASEIDTAFSRLVPAELLAHLGRERFVSGKDVVDPVVWQRVSHAFDLSATDYNLLVERHRALCEIAEERMRGLDGWVTPTTNMLAMPLGDYATVDAAAAWNALSSRNSRAANLFGQCAISLPIQTEPAALPVGLQIVCEARHDSKLLSIALAIEDVVGRPPSPDLSGFVDSGAASGSSVA